MKTIKHHNGGGILSRMATDLLRSTQPKPHYNMNGGYNVIQSEREQPRINSFVFGFKDGLLDKSREMTSIHRKPALDLISSVD